MQNPKSFLDSQQGHFLAGANGYPGQAFPKSPKFIGQNMFIPNFTGYSGNYGIKAPTPNLANSGNHSMNHTNKPRGKNNVQNFLAINNISNKIIIQTRDAGVAKGGSYFNEFIEFNNENKKVNEFRKNMKRLLQSDLSKDKILDYISKNSVINPGLSGRYANLNSLSNNLKQMQFEKQAKISQFSDPNLETHLKKRAKPESRLFILNTIL